MANNPPQTEKPFHYTYLKEFRVNQCPLFLQHKCTQHRPFTCFNWHFSNQRRRRPLRKRDGTFNYSADIYCSKYDETTGICPDGDDCGYLHRNTGDTERRYHLRYYKTGTCIHETDSRGNCVKNGPHCAFAHGARDLRPPVFDIREQQDAPLASNGNSSEQPKQELINLSEKIVNEDPKWQDANFILGNYKTEVCKRPPRLCRQGYACPQYHNTKDKRRNPKKFKYRSSPCPTVKQGDDWKDPTCCEKGDNCQFCHTRTEQQFHPEIYKSTKCHDMTQTGYCPRGPFCAFAHVEQEIRVVDDASSSPSSLLNVGSYNQLIPDNTLTNASEIVHLNNTSAPGGSYADVVAPTITKNLAWSSVSANANQSIIDLTQTIAQSSFGMDNKVSLPGCSSPLSKEIDISKTIGNNSFYSKAPGSERTSSNEQAVLSNNTFGSIGSSSAWPSLIPVTNIIGSFSSRSSSPSTLISRQVNSLNSDAPPFYPADETVDSVVGSALKDIDDPKLDEDATNHSMSKLWSHSHTRSSSHDTNISSSLFTMSDPVNIPNEHTLRENIPNKIQSGISSLSSPVLGSMEFPSAGSIPGGRYFPMHQSSSFTGSAVQTGMSSSIGSGILAASELERMQNKCKKWEESWNQAKAACDAWKKEATEANERARLSEDRSRIAIERYKFIENKFLNNNASGDNNNKCPFLHQQYEVDDLRKLSVSSLKQLQTKYKSDLEVIEKLIWEMLWKPQQRT